MLKKGVKGVDRRETPIFIQSFADSCSAISIKKKKLKHFQIQIFYFFIKIGVTDILTIYSKVKNGLLDFTTFIFWWRPN